MWLVRVRLRLFGLVVALPGFGFPSADRCDRSWNAESVPAPLTARRSPISALLGGIPRISAPAIAASALRLHCRCAKKADPGRHSRPEPTRPVQLPAGSRCSKRTSSLPNRLLEIASPADQYRSGGVLLSQRFRGLGSDGRHRGGPPGTRVPLLFALFAAKQVSPKGVNSSSVCTFRGSRPARKASDASPNPGQSQSASIRRTGGFKVIRCIHGYRGLEEDCRLIRIFT